MKKIVKYGTLVLAVVIVVGLASIVIIRHNPGKTKETYSDVRAYRAEVSPDTEIYDDNVAGDPFAYPMREELRNKSAEAFGIINAARQEQGLKPLAWDAALEYAAHTRVNEIAVMFDKNHLRPNGTYWFSVLYEARRLLASILQAHPATIYIIYRPSIWRFLSRVPRSS